jgi:hypothetical protein
MSKTERQEAANASLWKRRGEGEGGGRVVVVSVCLARRCIGVDANTRRRDFNPGLWFVTHLVEFVGIAAHAVNQGSIHVCEERGRSDRTQNVIF